MHQVSRVHEDFQQVFIGTERNDKDQATHLVGWNKYLQTQSQTQDQTGEDIYLSRAFWTGTNDPDTLPAGIVDSSLDVVQQDSQDQCDGPAMTQSDYPRDQSERSDLPTVASTCQPTKNEVADADVKTRYPRRPRRRPPDRWM